MAAVDLPDWEIGPRPAPIAECCARIKYFAGERIRTGTVVRRLFGRELGRCQLAALAGVPEGADVAVGVYRDGLYLEFSDPPWYRYGGVTRVVGQAGRPVVAIDALHVHRPELRGHGLGRRIFARQLRAADALNLRRIETHAGRCKDENGYYTWPRYGFAGRLPGGLRHRLPPEMAGAVDVLDLMESAEGRTWWRRWGVAMRVAFDTSRNSRCRQAFARYYAEKEARDCHIEQLRP